ncbi:hypothetical protein [Micromonospora echinofusca]|uniref:hypothetical protein n=1 Tax=Micromonospora echinofusca TaxID=47858 RepID=UPI003406F320
MAGSNAGTTHANTSRVARLLRERTGFPYAAEDVASTLHLAAPILTGTYGVHADYVPKVAGGWRWRLSVTPYVPETA